MHEGNEFELAFSEIQRETGAANITMKRALEALEGEGWIEVKPGRNSRYARFQVKAQQTQESPPEEMKGNDQTTSQNSPPFKLPEGEELEKNNVVIQFLELERIVESLRRRLRTQEMTIALLQERVAELEDKHYKR